jgi:hypothetical protein
MPSEATMSVLHPRTHSTSTVGPSIFFTAFMGNTVGNQVLFPAPEPTYSAEMQGLIWDTQESSGVDRPFLYVNHRSKQGRAPTILYFHANACDIGSMAAELRDLSMIVNCNILAVEYPGYGVFRGSISAEGINQAAEHSVEFLMKQGVHPSEMIFFGRSIGTGPATRYVNAHTAKT